MEEKERFELFGEHCIKDNNPDARCQLLDTYKACVILNEFEIPKIKEIALKYDERAFISVNDLNEVKGKGFKERYL